MAKKNCKTVTFRNGKNGRKLATPIKKRLCDRGPGKPAKRAAGRAAARAACRKGGAKGKGGMAKFRAKQFVACP